MSQTFQQQYGGNAEINAINVKIKLLRDPSRPLPSYATAGSAAIDLRAEFDGDAIYIEPNHKALIPTGIAIAPESSNVVAIIAARSGLAVKHGICLSNGIGVIDSDYRGEICVGLYNTGSETFKIAKGDRIAQMLFMPVFTANLIPTDNLDDTDRGDGGFGSTGKS